MLMESEFEFDISGIRTVESIAYAADELFYKGWLLPLHFPFRIQMVEKLDELLSSEVKQKDVGNRQKNDSLCVGRNEELGFIGSHITCDLTNNNMVEKLNKFLSSEIEQDQQQGRSEDIGNRIDSQCAGQNEELGFTSSRTSCNVGSYKSVKETYSEVSETALDRKKLLDSNQSQPGVIAHELRAGSKAYLDSSMEGLGDHDCNNSIQREKYDHEDGEGARRSIHRRNLYASDHKTYLNPLGFSKLATANQSGAFLCRSTSSASSDTENDIEEAIAHCKKSLSSDADIMISSSEDMEGTTSNAEGYEDDFC